MERVDLKKKIRDIPDFPEPGIVFKDITPLLADFASFKKVVDILEEMVGREPIDLIAAIESRGFIFGTALAQRLGVGFVPVRKEGKLPFKKINQSYDLEYGTATVEIHEDAIKPGDKVLIVDDLIATGGTAKATLDLVKKLGGEVVALVFLIELKFLKGREKISDHKVISLIEYEE